MANSFSHLSKYFCEKCQKEDNKNNESVRNQIQPHIPLKIKRLLLFTDFCKKFALEHIFCCLCFGPEIKLSFYEKTLIL
jgi:hypothetical protein